MDPEKIPIAIALGGLLMLLLGVFLGALMIRLGVSPLRDELFRLRREVEGMRQDNVSAASRPWRVS